MKHINIVYAVARMDLGGTQTHLLQVLRLLDRDRFCPMLYCLTGDGALLPTVRDLGVPVIDGAMRNGFRPAQAAKGALQLARFLRRERVQIIHNYLIRANVVGSVAGRLARVPVVLCSKRGCHERRGLELAGARLANWLADRVMTNAEAVRDFVSANEGCPKQKMSVIPSGVDTDRFRPRSSGAEQKMRLGLDPLRPAVGIVTRMRVRKGVEEFLRAMVLVRRNVPGVQAVIVGEVELDGRLQAMAREGDLAKDLWLLGRRSDMPEVLSAFDLFVLSSHDEGMSNAILEAMAMETAVVATDVGGTREAVRHGRTGLLVPPRDPDALAVAIAELLRAPNRCVEMGLEGRRFVEENLSARSMVRQMERVYMELLSEGGERTAPWAAGAPSSEGGMR